MVFTSLIPFPIAVRVDFFLNKLVWRYKTAGWMRPQQRIPQLSILIDLLRGLLSGFPICCVMSFIRITTLGKRKEDPYDFEAGFKAGYQLCPRCARNGKYQLDEKRTMYLVGYHYSKEEIDFHGGIIKSN